MLLPVQPTTRNSLCGTLNGQHISIIHDTPSYLKPNNRLN